MVVCRAPPCHRCTRFELMRLSYAENPVVPLSLDPHEQDVQCFTVQTCRVHCAMPYPAVNCCVTHLHDAPNDLQSRPHNLKESARRSKRQILNMKDALEIDPQCQRDTGGNSARSVTQTQ